MLLAHTICKLSTPQSRRGSLVCLFPFWPNLQISCCCVHAHQDPLGISHFLGPLAQNIPYSPPPPPSSPGLVLREVSKLGPELHLSSMVMDGLVAFEFPMAATLWSLSWVGWGDITLLGSRIYVKKRNGGWKVTGGVIRSGPIFVSWGIFELLSEGGHPSRNFTLDILNLCVLHDSLHIHLTSPCFPDAWFV